MRAITLLMLFTLGCDGTPADDTNKLDDTDNGEVCDVSEAPVCAANSLTRCVDGAFVDEGCDHGCASSGDRCNDCPPTETWCAGDLLTTCSADGSGSSTVLCDLGCDSARLACNSCIPDDASCVGDDLITCGGDGQVITTLRCDFGCSDLDGFGGAPASCDNACESASECDDANPCTSDSCDPDPLTGLKRCTHTNDDSLVPDDALSCTVDSCSGGVADHVPLDLACDDGLACTSDTCDPSDVRSDPLSGCILTPVNSVCADNASCTSDLCDPNDPGADADGCVVTPDHAACDDGFACTGTERCDPSDPTSEASSGCAPGTPDLAVCDDSVDCTDDACVGGGGDADGCSHTTNDSVCSGGVCFASLDCQPYPAISGLSPNNSLAGVDLVGLTITGTDFSAGASVLVDGVAASCDDSGVPNVLRCDVPGGLAGVVDVIVTNDTGLSDTQAGGFSWTTVGTDVDFCTVQYPRGASVNAGSSVDVYGQAWEPGLTDASASPAAGLIGDVGRSALDPNGVGLDPTASSAWRWVPAGINPAYDYSQNNDELFGAIDASAAGSYRYAVRFSLDGGLSWTYCDADDSNGGFDAAALSTLTVTP